MTFETAAFDRGPPEAAVSLPGGHRIVVRNTAL